MSSLSELHKNINKLNYLFIVIMLLFSHFAKSQKSLNNESHLWKNESFGHMNIHSEVTSLRSEYSKHFRNENGKITAVITAGPMHYSQNGKWNTIYHSLIPNSTGFENTTNKHKTYYPALASGNIVTVLENGTTLKDMIGMRMYYQSNGNEIKTKTIQNQNGQVKFNEVTYNSVYGSGIDLRLTQNTTNRKMDYIIKNKSALGNIPSNADYLVFEEIVELPNGWKAILNGKQIDLKDGSGEIIAFYDQPRYTDTDIHANHKHEENEPHNHHVNEIIGDYEISQQGNLLTIKTLVPVNWLKQDLNFPVYIDPTIHLYPNNSARWTGHHVTTSGTNCVSSECANYISTNITGSVDGDFMMGRFDTYQVYNGWIKFNVTDIPDDACISSAAFGYHAVDLNSYDATCNVGTRIRHMATDPSANDFSVGANNQARLADIRDGDIFNDLNTAVVSQGAGWRTVNLTANLNHLQSQLIPNWFALGLNVHSGASGHITCRYSIMGHGHSVKPQLSVEYENAISTENITICSGQLPYTWYGQTINTGGNGVATHTGTGANGCDLEITLNLTVNPGTPAQTENITICSNELPYSWNGQTITTGGNGAATHTATDVNGCNYNITLNLTVNPTTNLTDDISICSSQLPYTWNGQVINTGGNGVATHTTQDANGCTVITTLNLTVNNETNLTDDITICESELPYSWNGQTITIGGNGIATHTVQDANGCTINTTLNLTVITTTPINDDITICENELPYSWNGQSITTGGNGVATHTVQDANGCTVTTTLNLTIITTTPTSENITICESDLPYIWHGQTITTGGNGIASHTTQDVNGCDIVTTLNLTVNPITYLIDNITICNSELPYTWNSQIINSGGNGIATHITQDVNGCNITTTLNLTVLSPASLNFIAQADNCTPANVNIVPTATIPGGICTWEINGNLVNGNCAGLDTVINQTGCYDVSLSVIDGNGCLASTTQNNVFCIHQSPDAIFTLNNQTVTNIQTTNSSTNATSYVWLLPDGTTSSVFEPSISIGTEPGIYNVTLYTYTVNGCSDSMTLSFEVINDLVIPNVITANGDGINDYFILDGLIPNTKLLILNRWGNLIYQTDNYDNTWAGQNLNGNLVTEGVYTYIVTLPDGEKRHGFVHVVH
jgi:gliding motility-associated-like protein